MWLIGSDLRIRPRRVRIRDQSGYKAIGNLGLGKMINDQDIMDKGQRIRVKVVGD